MLTSKLKMVKAIHPIHQRSRARRFRQANALQQDDGRSSALEHRITRRCEMAIAGPQQDMSHNIPEGRAT